MPDAVPLSASAREPAGADDAADARLPGDDGVWIRDLGSRNGTYLNGERIAGERALRPDDEIRVGETRLVYRTRTEAQPPTPTEAAQRPPDVTRRERDVLIALCRPVLSRSVLAEPAGIRDIATELVLSESAVKKHLGRLFDKFEIYEPSERRRGRLVSEAIRRGAVGITDL